MKKISLSYRWPWSHHETILFARFLVFIAVSAVCIIQALDFYTAGFIGIFVPIERIYILFWVIVGAAVLVDRFGGTIHSAQEAIWSNSISIFYVLLTLGAWMRFFKPLTAEPIAVRGIFVVVFLLISVGVFVHREES